jgi:CO/xanthine dehydrogenase FAD-binding subunit
MRAFLPAYDLYAPGTLAEALDLLSADQAGWRPFAGGTDLMVQLEAGALPEGRYLGLWKLPELGGIREEAPAGLPPGSTAVGPAGVAVGALTTYTQMLESPAMRRHFPLICQAARETGGVATQNKGTIGGNIANASPAADTPPALLAYDAELELVSGRGVRRVPYASFHLGYRTMDLAPDELIARVHLPQPAGRNVQYYRKVGTRRAQAISKVCLAATFRIDDGIVHEPRIALGSLAPTVRRARHAEDVLQGQRLTPRLLRSAQEALGADISPIDDIRSTARYRQRVAERLLEECLRPRVRE